MRIDSVRKIGLLLVFIISGFTLQAQQDTLGTERLIIIKPYSPSVSDAFKVKQTPKIDESKIAPKKQPEYTVIKVPVASTFKPQKGTAASVETEPLPYLYDNYAVLGFGNHTSILAELYSTFWLSDAQSLGLAFRHNSNQGGIDNVLLDDKYYNTELDMDFSANGTYFNWGIDFGAMHKSVNWYGVPKDIGQEVIAEIDPQQNYYGVSLGGNIEYYDGLFNSAELTYRRFGDAYGSGENHIKLQPKFGIPIGNTIVSLDMILDYVGGHFDRHYDSDMEMNYSNLHLGAHPSLAIRSGRFNLDLGAALFYAMNFEFEQNDFYIYPKVKVSYQMAEGYFIPYAGADGGLHQNTYYGFVQKNPFVSPTLYITPTSNVYDFYLGAKGKFTEQLGYNFKVNYRHDDNKALFISHPSGYFALNEAYKYENSFKVVYDDLTTLGFHVELTMDVNDDFQLRLNAEYFDYDIDTQEEPWNLPNIKASLNTNYQINEKWSAGADLFFMGERKARNLVMGDFPPFQTITAITLDAYFDFNLNVHYQFNEHLGAFLKGHNLLGNNYERWMDYPVLGAQVMGGVTYRFNW